MCRGGFLSFIQVPDKSYIKAVSKYYGWKTTPCFLRVYERSELDISSGFGNAKTVFFLERQSRLLVEFDFKAFLLV